MEHAQCIQIDPDGQLAKGRSIHHCDANVKRVDTVAHDHLYDRNDDVGKARDQQIRRRRIIDYSDKPSQNRSLHILIRLH